MYKDNVRVKQDKRTRIRKRIRKKLSGTQQRPRVLFNKSNRYLYVQAIDDENGSVLAAASTLEKQVRSKSKNAKNTQAAKILGETMTSRLKAKKIKTLVFDRGVYPYHGRIKTMAEVMRKGGLKF